VIDDSQDDLPTIKRSAVSTTSPLEQKKPDPIPHRQIWGGAGALLLVMVLILVVPRVLQRAGSVASTAQATPTALPTATATPAPETPAQAWGASAIAHYPMTLADGTTFVPTDIAPDGSLLVGYATPPGTTPAPYFIEAVTLPALHVRQLYQMPADAALPTVKTDGQFAAWIGGATSPTGQSPVHQIIGYINLQTGNYNILYDTYALRFNPHVIAVAAGQFFWSPQATPTQLNDTDMASANNAPVDATNGRFAFAQSAVLQVDWPHLLYLGSDNLVHVYNVQTQQDHTFGLIPVVPFLVRLAGSAIYWPQSLPTGGTEIETIANVDQGSTASQSVVALPAASSLAQLVVTNRLVAWDDGTHFVAWDRQTHLFVTLHARPQTALGVVTLAAKSNEVWFEADDNGAFGIDVMNTVQLGAS
jgi:hypothetical protein